MHRKKVLYIQEGMQPYARYSRVVSELDADFVVCLPRDTSEHLSSCDMVMCAVDAAHAGNLTDLENILQSADCSLFMIVDEDALPRLRMPAHLASDFIVTTASDEEMAIRLRRLLYPGVESASSDFITVDSMVINLSTYQVIVDSEPVDFTYLEYALLAFLVTHPGHAYSRDALLSRVWGFDYYGGSRTVDVHVRRVRSKLGSELAAHLRTVRGVGYMWE